MFDPSARTAEQKIEFKLIESHVSMIARHMATLTPEQLRALTKLACIPEMSRGKGHLKEVNLRSGAREQARVLAELENRGYATVAE